jgi:hypothetical protein
MLAVAKVSYLDQLVTPDVVTIPILSVPTKLKVQETQDADEEGVEEQVGDRRKALSLPKNKTGKNCRQKNASACGDGDSSWGFEFKGRSNVLTSVADWLCQPPYSLGPGATVISVAGTNTSTPTSVAEAFKRQQEASSSAASDASSSGGGGGGGSSSASGGGGDVAGGEVAVVVFRRDYPPTLSQGNVLLSPLSCVASASGDTDSSSCSSSSSSTGGGPKRKVDDDSSSFSEAKKMKPLPKSSPLLSIDRTAIDHVSQAAAVYVSHMP